MKKKINVYATSTKATGTSLTPKDLEKAVKSAWKQTTEPLLYDLIYLKSMGYGKHFKKPK